MPRLERVTVPSACRHLGPLGSDDARDLAAGTQALFDAGLVVRGPEQAARRVETVFGCELDLSGDACTGMNQLRDWCVAHDPQLARALLICAPHTHWDRGQFVAEQFDATDSAYHIGPSALLPRDLTFPLLPMSFVFDAEGPIAFEWTDATTAQSFEHVEPLWRGICRMARGVAQSFAGPTFPLGITTRHRFKRIWDGGGSATTEKPEAGGDHYATVRLVSDDAIPDPAAVQVGWSLFRSPVLTREDEKNLGRLEAAIGHVPLEDRDAFLEAIAAALREQVDGIRA